MSLEVQTVQGKDNKNMRYNTIYWETKEPTLPNNLRESQYLNKKSVHDLKLTGGRIITYLEQEHEKIIRSLQKPNSNSWETVT